MFNDEIEDTPCLDTTFRDIERSATTSTAWDRWVAQAERMAGHSLDGDEFEGDGYSLDGAHEAFRAGMSASLYVAGINRRKREFHTSPFTYFEEQRTRLHNFIREEQYYAN